MPAPQERRLLVLFSVAAALAPRVVAQVTESPQTVAPGSVLVEMDGLRLALDRDRDGRYTGLAVASTLVSAGLTQSLDVQAGIDVFLKETTTIGGERDSSSGLGDLAFRMKWTFWRNESLGAAMAVIPYVNIPSSTGGVGSDTLEGGLIVPWAMTLRGGTSAGAMFRWDMVRNDAKDGFDAEWQATGFVQQQVTKALAFYGEATVATSSAGASNSTGTVGVGGLFQFTQAIQFDYEVLRGVNSRTAEWTHVFRVNWGW